jgi:hypothetical protein
MCLTDTLFRLHLYFYLTWRQQSGYALLLYNQGAPLGAYAQAVREASRSLKRAGDFQDLMFPHFNLLPARAASLVEVA